MSANQPNAAWAGTGDPLVVVAGHLVSPEDNFGEIGRMANGNLRRPNRIEAGTGGIHGQVTSVITRFGAIPSLDLRRANGTEAAPTAVLNGETLADLNFIGHDGTAFGGGSRVRGIALENWAVGAHAAGLDFFSVPVGSVVVTNRWRLLAAGHLVAAADNTVDIGEAGASRPRNIIARTGVAAGASPAASGDIRMAYGGQGFRARRFSDAADAIMMTLDTFGGADDVILIGGPGSTDIAFRSRALVALGGGAAPTLGTIGGVGPTAAAQNSWAQFRDSTGAAMWFPVWK